MQVEYTYEQIARLSNARLLEIFRQGATPDIKKLLGYEFRGFNTPAFAKLIGIQKFKKGFYSKDGKPFGYNIPVRQNGLDGPWICKPNDDNPKRFGFYSLNPPGTSPLSSKEPQALLLNYADGKNGIFEGAMLRDYVVQPYRDNADLYIGKAYIEVAGILVFSNYFIIERHRESAWK